MVMRYDANDDSYIVNIRGYDQTRYVKVADNVYETKLSDIDRKLRDQDIVSKTIKYIEGRYT